MVEQGGKESCEIANKAGYLSGLPDGTESNLTKYFSNIEKDIAAKNRYNISTTRG